MANTAELKVALDKSSAILKKLKPAKLSKKISEMNLTEYAEEITKRGIDLDEQLIRSEGAAPSTIKQFINDISGVSGFEDSEIISFVNDLRVNSSIPGHVPVTIRERQEEFFQKRYNDLINDINGYDLTNSGFNIPTFNDSLSYRKKYNQTLYALQDFTKESLQEPYLRQSLIEQKAYSEAYFNNSQYTGKKIGEKISFLSKKLHNIDKTREMTQQRADDLFFHAKDYNIYSQKRYNDKLDAFNNLETLEEKRIFLNKLEKEQNQLTQANINLRIIDFNNRYGLDSSRYDYLGDRTEFRSLNKYAQNSILNDIESHLKRDGNLDSLYQDYDNIANQLSDKPERYDGLKRFNILRRNRIIQDKYDNIEQSISDKKALLSSDQYYGIDPDTGDPRLNLKRYEYDKEGNRYKPGDVDARLHGAIKRKDEIVTELADDKYKDPAEFNKYYSSLDSTKKKEVAAMLSKQDRPVRSVRMGDITYYYREGDKLPPEIEAAKQKQLEEQRVAANKAKVKEQQKAATEDIENHQIWVPKTNRPVKNKSNPSNAVNPQYLSENDIIDSLMENADNVNSGFQSEVANPAKTTLKDTLRLSETALNGFKMENAGTMIGGLGALTLFEASMYANNSDAELHRRRVEEERRRKKYGY